jgi:hypothetical protein
MSDIDLTAAEADVATPVQLCEQSGLHVDRGQVELADVFVLKTATEMADALVSKEGLLDQILGK